MRCYCEPSGRISIVKSQLLYTATKTIFAEMSTRHTYWHSNYDTGASTMCFYTWNHERTEIACATIMTIKARIVTHRIASYPPVSQLFPPLFLSHYPVAMAVAFIRLIGSNERPLWNRRLSLCLWQVQQSTHTIRSWIETPLPSFPLLHLSLSPTSRKIPT